MPEISIVTPSLNQGRFIERTIRSVLDQYLGGRQLEYLVVDGGSCDETIDILRGSPGLRWLSEPDRGQADAINKGLRLTTGGVVGWLNSDDIYYPDALRVVCECFELHPDVDVVYGDANHIDEMGSVLGPYVTENWDVERLKDICFLCQPAVFVRREIVELAGGLDDRLQFCMDYEYWLRLAQSGASFARLPRLVAGSRLYPQTKTLGSRIRVHAEINEMLRTRLGRVPDRWLFNYGHALLEPTRINPSQRVRFSVAVSLLSMYAALKWNRCVSAEMIGVTARWIRGSVVALPRVKT